MIEFLPLCLYAARFLILLSNIDAKYKIGLVLLSFLIPIKRHSIDEVSDLNENQRLTFVTTLGRLILYFMFLFVSYEDKLISKTQVYVLLLFIFIHFVNDVIFIVEMIEREDIIKQDIPDVFIPVFLSFIIYNYFCEDSFQSK